MVKLNILAADIHRRMVEDDRFGYSWAERYGSTPETWDVDGVPITINVGDYDCSSSTITAWKLALRAGGYSLNGATYTGNMKSAFLATGLFKWVDWQKAERGDLLLNEGNHVAMCQGGMKLSEFSINEFGGTYGGVRGDQTGREARMNNIYNYPWDGCLHYIGTKEVGKSSNIVQPTATAKFRVRQNGKWLNEGQVGKRGTAITGIAISMPGWYQVCTEKYGWLERVYFYDTNDDNGYAGWQDSPVTAVRCYYETPEPDKTGWLCAKYRVAAVNQDYYDWQVDDDVSDTMDGYAGDFVPIDRFELTIE